jgi:AcrR family transcriptional regulator
VVDVAESSAAPKRKYNSARRQHNAAQTRATILDAAREQFTEHGWQGAGMREIAKQAGVAVETVYSNFPTKAALLKEVLNVLVVGDDQPIALSDRAEFRAIAVGPLRDRLEAMARLTAAIHSRGSRLRMVLREAARADDELAETERTVVAEELAQARMFTGLFFKGASDRDVEGWQAFSSSDVYVLLTTVYGWDSEQYVAWLTETSEALLAAKGVVQ